MTRHLTERHRRVVAVVNTVVAVAGLAAIGLGGGRSGATEKAPAAIVIHQVADGGHQPLDRGSGAFFVLAVGNDRRPGLEGQRADALHLIGVNPVEHRATILNIPRDTYVGIPGHGNDKITLAYLVGGLQLQVQTVAGLTGAPISFVVEVDFTGFQALVDEMGGVPVTIPYAMRDANSGANFAAGPTSLGGGAALAFARNRGVPNGDISRTAHQGLLLLGGLQKARESVHSPVDFLRLVALISRHATVDGVGLRELAQLVALGLSIDPVNVRSVTMPSSVGFVGPAAVVFARPEAADLFADFRDDAILQRH